MEGRQALPARPSLDSYQPGERVRRAPAIRNRSPSGNSRGLQPLDHAGQHRGFAAVQVISAAGVNDDAIRWVSGGNRRVAQPPDGETL